MIFIRGENASKRWDDEQDRKLLELREKNIPYYEIAITLERSSNACMKRYSILKKRKEQEEEKEMKKDCCYGIEEEYNYDSHENSGNFVNAVTEFLKSCGKIHRIQATGYYGHPEEIAFCYELITAKAKITDAMIVARILELVMLSEYDGITIEASHEMAQKNGTIAIVESSISLKR